MSLNLGLDLRWGAGHYDLWVGEHGHKHVQPILKNGEILPTKQNRGIARVAIA
jgi:hypothetical protein